MSEAGGGRTVKTVMGVKEDLEFKTRNVKDTSFHNIDLMRDEGELGFACTPSACQWPLDVHPESFSSCLFILQGFPHHLSQAPAL